MCVQGRSSSPVSGRHKPATTRSRLCLKCLVRLGGRSDGGESSRFRCAIVCDSCASRLRVALLDSASIGVQRRFLSQVRGFCGWGSVFWEPKKLSVGGEAWSGFRGLRAVLECVAVGVDEFLLL